MLAHESIWSGTFDRSTSLQKLQSNALKRTFLSSHNSQNTPKATSLFLVQEPLSISSSRNLLESFHTHHPFGCCVSPVDVLSAEQECWLQVPHENTGPCGALLPHKNQRKNQWNNSRRNDHSHNRNSDFLKSTEFISVDLSVDLSVDFSREIFFIVKQYNQRNNQRNNRRRNWRRNQRN